MPIGTGVTKAMLVIAGVVLTATAQGQAPSGSTGECKDGTYTSAPSKRGACSGHGGVKEWYTEGKAAGTEARAPAPAPAAAAAPSKSAVKSTEASTTAAAGGAGSTGECKDGTYTSAPSKRGACSGHGGVKEWYSESKTSAPAAPATTKAAAPAPAAPAAPSKSAPRSTEMPTTAAAGGGPGKVWVNTSSKVYHCPNDKWYGKTKSGEYMSEAEAKAAGNHPDHGKACS